jgi:N-acetylmuramoyl-L-alanine amidase CwlA
MSFQYVVGNDGIYHNIPDDEIAHHAGDGADKDSYFDLYETGVFGNDSHPKVLISEDGFFLINNEKTKIKSSINSITNKYCTEEEINDLGIFTQIKDGQYFIGKTWYSKKYNFLCNKGGNCNSIGIESCINDGTDIYYTIQKLAKLVAYLMKVNNLGIDRVVQHHYFSGKNCPQTIRKAKLWEFFKELVIVEFEIQKYIDLGFKISLKDYDTSYMNNVGRIIKLPNFEQKISYSVEITDNKGESQIINLESNFVPKSIE